MKLVILGPGKERLGEVTQDGGGNFYVEAESAEVKKEIAQMIDDVACANPTLPLKGGHTEETEEGVQAVTTSKEIERGQPEYLSALWDYFNHHRGEYKIGGKEIFVHTEE